MKAKCLGEVGQRARAPSRSVVPVPPVIQRRQLPHAIIRGKVPELSTREVPGRPASIDVLRLL